MKLSIEESEMVRDIPEPDWGALGISPPSPWSKPGKWHWGVSVGTNINYEVTLTSEASGRWAITSNFLADAKFAVLNAAVAYILEGSRMFDSLKGWIVPFPHDKHAPSRAVRYRCSRAIMGIAGLTATNPDLLDGADYNQLRFSIDLGHYGALCLRRGEVRFAIEAIAWHRRDKFHEEEARVLEAIATRVKARAMAPVGTLTPKTSPDA